MSFNECIIKLKEMNAADIAKEALLVKQNKVTEVADIACTNPLGVSEYLETAFGLTCNKENYGSVYTKMKHAVNEFKDISDYITSDVA